MKRVHTTDIVFALALLGVFASSVLMVLLGGARVYRGIADSLKRIYEEQSCLSYIAVKLRHFDSEGAVKLTEFGDGDALLLKQTIDGVEYGTVIYVYQGKVMELFAELPLEFGPEMGNAILSAEDLSFAWRSGNLLHVEYTGQDGNSAGIDVALRATGEGGRP